MNKKNILLILLINFFILFNFTALIFFFSYNSFSYNLAYNIILLMDYLIFFFYLIILGSPQTNILTYIFNLQRRMYSGARILYHHGILPIRTVTKHFKRRRSGPTGSFGIMGQTNRTRNAILAYTQNNPS